MKLSKRNNPDIRLHHRLRYEIAKRAQLYKNNFGEPRRVQMTGTPRS